MESGSEIRSALGLTGLRLRLREFVRRRVGRHCLLFDEFLDRIYLRFI